MSKAFVSTARAALVSSAVAFAFCVLIGRLFYLHVWEQEALLEHVESNRRMVQIIEARRGNVVDNRGNLLATTHTRIDLGVDPQSVRETDREKFTELANLIDQPLEKVIRAIETKTRRGSDHAQAVSLIKWAYLAKGLDEDTYDKVRELGIKGVLSIFF